MIHPFLKLQTLLGNKAKGNKTPQAKLSALIILWFPFSDSGEPGVMYPGGKYARGRGPGASSVVTLTGVLNRRP